MKLPGAQYEGRVGSLGRDVSDPTALSRAKFQTATAMGDIAQALGQTTAVAEAWLLAREESKANKALADYHGVMTAALTDLTKTPAIPVESMPDGVSYEKEEVLPTGERVERKTIPSWEAAPLIYDKLNKDASNAALKQVQHGPTRAKLANAIQEFSTRQTAAVGKLHFEGRKNQLIGDNEAAIQAFVRQPGGEVAAANVVDSMVRSGLYSPLEGIQRKLKIAHDASDLAASRELSDLTKAGDYDGLEKFAVNIYNVPTLSADERRNYAQSAAAKAESIYNRKTTEENKKREEQSKRMLGTLETRVRLESHIPSPAELAKSKEMLTGADYLTYLAVIDSKDGKGVKTDQAEKRRLSLQIMGLDKPDEAGVPADRRAALLREQIQTAFVQKKLDYADRDYLYSELDKARDMPLNTKEARAASAKIEVELTAPKDSFSKLGLENTVLWNVVAKEMQDDLRVALRENPKLDPEAWVNQNLPKYKLRFNEPITQRMSELGFTSYLVRFSNGDLNIAASKAKVLEVGEKNLLPPSSVRAAINALELGNPNYQGASGRPTGESNVRDAIKRPNK
jgi:hypothetical protein